MDYLCITNWKKYQHYHTGKAAERPPWVKFYVKQLRDPQLKRLPIPTRLLWDQLILLAAEYNNSIPFDVFELVASTRIPEELLVLGVEQLIEIEMVATKKPRGRPRAKPSLALESSYDESRTEETREEEIREDKIAPLSRRAEVWDALASELGEAVTKTARSVRGKCVNELVAVGATDGDVHQRAGAYRLHYPGMALTDLALVKHWSGVMQPLPAGTAMSAGQMETALLLTDGGAA
jgi:hypothetical protein